MKRPSCSLLRLIFLTMLLGASSCYHDAKPTHVLYTYHAFPPYIYSEAVQDQSLSELLISVVSESTKENFELVVLSRSELNEKIRQGAPVLVLWANKNWFPNTSVVASEPIVWDSNIIVAQREHPVKSSQPEDLVGKRFCRIKGHNYGKLNGWLDRGSILSQPAMTPDDCIKLLEQGRVDVIQMQRSRYYSVMFKKHHNEIIIAEPTVDSFSRHILMFNEAKTNKVWIDDAILRLKNNQQWRDGLNELGGEKFVKLFDMNLSQLKEIKVDIED